MRTTRVMVTALGGLGVLVAVSACTQSGGGSSSGGAGYAAAASAASGGSGGSRNAASGGSGAVAETAGDVAILSAKIRTVDLSVQVGRGTTVAAQADRAETIALGAGGEVDSDDRTSGRDAQATMLLRVPPEQLTGVLRALDGLGRETSRQSSTKDVTAKVADVTSRVASAREAIAQLRALYSRATKVADVITVESELAQRESDLESLEAQQRALRAQTATAAITLTLTSPPRHAAAPPKPAHHRSGFVGGLANGWDAFVGVAGGVATAVGAMLPFLVVLAILAVLGRLAWTRLRPHDGRPTDRPPASETS